MYAVNIYRMAAVQIHHGQTHVAALKGWLLTIVQLEAWLDRLTNSTTARLGLCHEHLALHAGLLRDQATAWHARNDENNSQPRYDLYNMVL
jgi:hypothetical protein